MSEFDTLLTQVRACTLCAVHLPLGPRPVVRLSPTVKILITSQAPGTKVHASGVPFTDVSGERLRAWLGLNSEQFYDVANVGIMPMGFCYPGKGKGGDLPPRPECAPLWHAKLLAHLPNVKLTILGGSYAVGYYLPQHKGKTLTQIVREWDGEPFIPLVHPSPRNKLWIAKNPWFEGEMLPEVRRRVKAALS